jgi:hypothetical protein
MSRIPLAEAPISLSVPSRTFLKLGWPKEFAPAVPRFQAENVAVTSRAGCPGRARQGRGLGFAETGPATLFAGARCEMGGSEGTCTLNHQPSMGDKRAGSASFALPARPISTEPANSGSGPKPWSRLGMNTQPRADRLRRVAAATTSADQLTATLFIQPFIELRRRLSRLRGYRQLILRGIERS